VLTNWEKFLDQTFRLGENEGKNKVIPLRDAVRGNVKPGMILYVGERANALIAELIRQFHGTRPDFSLVMLVVIEQALNLVHLGIVRNVVTASCTEFFPTIGPSPIITRAVKNKSVDIENWSLCSLNQRLLAGALDVPVMPTNSLAGSSMSYENRNSFCQIPNPFDTNESINLVRALKPDISLIHGWAADPTGNTILAPFASGGEHSNGAKASKDGVVVSVEHIVSSQFIREHSALVSIPGGIVKSVSLAKLGAHPQAMIGDYSVGEFEGYVDDYEFTWDRRRASRDPEHADKWIKKWVLDCGTHSDYLKQLGRVRVSSLMEKARKREWTDTLDIGEVSFQSEYNPREMMIIAAARRTKELVLKKGYDGILSGLGASGLPGWMAYYDLKRSDFPANLWLGSGVYGFSPCPGDPQLFSLPTVLTGKMLTDAINSYGIFICGNHRKKNMSILSAAQVDEHGNLNSTKLSETRYLIGSGGGNDASLANEVLVVIPQSVDRFVREVAYITCRGDNVTAIVSDMGILERIDGEFVLTTFFRNPKIPEPQKAILAIKEKCGWDLKVSPEVVEMPPPTLEELVLLRALDPKGFFIGTGHAE
jgi:acyl CoA:acetate/3-ketoacid CoA transferase alpha subunit